MAIYVIKMPDIGEGIAEVELLQWHVKPGDTVHEEQVLVDVMTDKANVEITARVAGKVVAITGKPGDVPAVGSEIIRLDIEGKGNIDESPPTPQGSNETLESPRPPEPKPAPIPHSVPSTGPLDRPLAAPAVRRRARELGIDLAHVSGSGPGGRITPADLQAPAGARSAVLPLNASSGGRFTPRPAPTD